MAYIEFNHVKKVYGEGRAKTVASKDINFTIEEGELVVILGPSGAGKSTILNMLGGMDKPTAGEIWVNGTNIAEYSEDEYTEYRRNRVGFVFQSYNLIPNLTAMENVEMSAEITDDPGDPVEFLDAVGLADRKNYFPAQLSGGEQQRVSIARALVKKPDLLLCDEPTGALDSKTGQGVLKVLQDQAVHGDSTVIIITHNRQIAKMADKVIEIDSRNVDNISLEDDPLSVSEIEW